MALTDAEKGRLKRAGLSGLNKPKRTPKHPTKKAVVAIRDGGKVKIIRFGDQKMGHNYSDERAKRLLLTGLIRCFGRGREVLKNLLQNLRNTRRVYSKGETMIKNISKWVMLIPIKLVEWAMWPVAQAHIQLTKLSKWIRKKL